jgi:DNA recombination protein RmuC
VLVSLIISVALNIFFAFILIFLSYKKVTISLNLNILQKEYERLSSENAELNKSLNIQKDLVINLNNNIIELKTNQKNYESSEKHMQIQFENLANKIFQNSTQELKEKSFSDITNILSPLKEKISEFEKRIEDSFNTDIKERYSLSKEITKMAMQTEQMIKETNNLTRTLRGEQKVQGTWGELILSKVLECSGLQAGRDYTLQKKLENNLIPDVVINLPDNKHFIIDAKTSLKHYELYLNTNNAEDLNYFLKSVKSHIKNLAGKEYHHSNELLNPGFVFMFIPIESAYSLALSHDPDLRSLAMQNKIFIVSPNSLIAMLQAVSSVWKIVDQNTNAAEIASKAGAMYDKFVLFLEELKKIGNSIKQAETAYITAMSRLKEGSGNLIKRAEALKDMGINSKKQINDDIL